MQDKSIKRALAELYDRIEQDHAHLMGFPAACQAAFSDIEPFLSKLLNNCGDPYVNGLNGFNTKDFEREVLAFFAEFFRAPQDDYWGYVNNGGTEGNLYALYIARQKYPKARVYYSATAHYSIPKNIHILGMKGVLVKAQPNGEMDYDDLRRLLKKQSGEPAIVVATIGTTMSEAKDSLPRIIDVLAGAGVTERYIHVDAALAGMYAGLLKPRHPFDFADGADSISVSGHKFIGTPMPCGVVLVHKSDKDRLCAQSNYTGTPDTTISGSRNGHAPLLLWWAIKTWDVQGLRQRAQDALQVADYAYAQLQAIGCNPRRNPSALTIVFASPPEPIMRKWQLASAGGLSHIICMPGLTKERVDAFVADLKACQTAS